MKSSPLKYSFVRFANWLICFWFNIMIIHKSSLSSISNSVSISQGMSWRTHGMASAVNVLTVSLIMGVVSTSGCCDHRPVCLIWWLSADGSVPLSESSSSNSHKCVIITGLDCVNISNVLHISAFKLWLCVCCKGIVVNKMNLKHHRMLLPLTADTPHQTPCLQLQTKHPQSQRWCGHQHGGCYDGHYTRWREENFPNIS